MAEIIDGMNVNKDFSVEKHDDSLNELSTQDLENMVKAEEAKVASAPTKIPEIIEPKINPVETKNEVEAPIVEQPTPEIPVKFQKTDGSLDEKKLEKANISLEEVLAKEREFTQLRQTNKATQTPEQATQFASFEDKVRQDFEADPVNTMIRLNNATAANSANANQAELHELRTRVEMSTFVQNNDITVDAFTGANEIRTESPNLTLQQALDIYKGRSMESVKAQPKPKAPIMPGNAPSAPSTTPSTITLANVESALKGKSEDEILEIMEKILPRQ